MTCQQSAVVLAVPASWPAACASLPCSQPWQAAAVVKELLQALHALHAAQTAGVAVAAVAAAAAADNVADNAVDVQRGQMGVV